MPPANPTSRVVVVDGVALPEVSVSSWPLRDEPLTTTVVLFAAVCLGAIVGVVSGSVVAGLLSTFAMLLALRVWWLPEHFHLNELGVKHTTFADSRRTPWREFAGYELRSCGIVLLTDGSATPLSLLRGMYIPYLTQKIAVTAIVEHHLASRQRQARGETVVRQPPADS